MKELTTASRRSRLALRKARFEDVAEILRLVVRAVAHGCRAHYDVAQRAAVCAAYTTTLFVDALGPLETLVAEREGHVVGFAQLDPVDGRVRALFVDADQQGRGVGGALVGALEACARRHGRARLHGSMALNAVPFYARAGFRACGGPERLSSTGVLVPIVRMEKPLGA
ncbi:MAG TPA: GNAT family N-acetyltransferase [Polyangia bacterium]|nr:GNAT family N-acetyltransferase [Polyangia bacterium]